MMKKSAIASILLVTLLSYGMTACNRPNSSDTSSSDPAQTNVASNSSAEGQTHLSPEARAQKRAALRQQVEAVLTPEQVKQLEAKLQQGSKMRRSVNSLNLTAEQKTKIQAILKAAYPHREKSPTAGAQ
ncbi:MAG: hypothetical protein DCF22_15135 [Leptolyngbya sp.]|nr:MAG: hypothetical protein DCF22_15135 [Leptolyngbya sp.]